MTREQRIRAYANHLGLIIYKRGDVFTLIERYDAKRRIGTYHSLATLERGIERYRQRVLRELEHE
jgi:hypothetical protein